MSCLLNPFWFGSGGGGAPNIPQSASLQYWFKADDGVYTDTAGTIAATDTDTAANWKNHGVHATTAVTQPTAGARLTYRDTGGLNSMPYLVGTRGTTHFGTFPFPGHTQLNGAFTYAVVVQSVNISGDESGLFSRGSSFSSDLSCYFRPTANAQIHFPNQDIRAGNLASASIVTGRLRDDAIGVNTASRLNGSVIGTHTTNPLDDTQDIAFLNHQNSNIPTFGGNIYEAMFWSRSLTDAEFGEVETYLSDKYGIVI